jgi:2-octaprenylphenol hydroxylase
MTQQYNDFDAVIIGAGIVGATLAALLAKFGRRIAVVESRLPPEFSADAPFELRVSAISRASQRALEAAGAWDSIQQKRAHAYEAMQVWDEGGNGEIRFEAATTGEPDLGHIIENTVIQSSLIEQLNNNDSVQLFYPSKIVGLSVVDGLQCAELDSGDYLRAFK